MIDPQLLSEAGSEMLVNKIPNPVQQLKFQAGMYQDIQVGALLVVDCRLIDNLPMLQFKRYKTVQTRGRAYCCWLTRRPWTQASGW